MKVSLIMIEVMEIAMECKPKLIIAGASCLCKSQLILRNSERSQMKCGALSYGRYGTYCRS